MRSPTPEELLSALRILHEAADPYDRRYSNDWHVIDAFLRAAVPIRNEHDQDAHQEALFAIARAVRVFDESHALAAAKWVIVIRRRRAIDLMRQRSRDPVARGLARSRDPDMDDPLTLISDAQLPDLSGDALESVVASIEDAVDEHLQESGLAPSARQMARLKAKASLQRLVLGTEAQTIIERVGGDEKMTAERIYKWVERGRPIVLAALDRWAENQDEAVVEAIRELFEKRRVDAGRPRPSRRKIAE